MIDCITPGLHTVAASPWLPSFYGETRAALQRNNLHFLGVHYYHVFLQSSLGYSPSYGRRQVSEINAEDTRFVLVGYVEDKTVFGDVFF